MSNTLFMKFRFTIGRKIGFGFFALIFLTLVAFLFTTKILTESRDKTDQIVQTYTPSVSMLKDLKSLLVKSQNLITKWYFFQSSDDYEEKNELRRMLRDDYPELKTQIIEISQSWTEEDKNSIHAIFSLVDRVFVSYQVDIMSKLSSFDSYEDPSIKFMVTLPFEEDLETSNIIFDQLSELVERQEKAANRISSEMLSSFTFLQNLVRVIGFVLVLGGIIIATFTVRSIVSPIVKLKAFLQMMGRGVIPDEKIEKRNDEIGEMSVALEYMKEGLRRTTEFANEVGAGNFNSGYVPLSKEDTLGHALLKMREDLAEYEGMLEDKVRERTEEVVQQKEVIETKNRKLEQLYKQVTDSILYAKRIQLAILPPDEQMRKLLPQSFVYHRPKDIVSGDFYWIHEKDGKVLFAVVDCTGHGVPGAFMSIVGYNQLRHVMLDTKVTRPSVILQELNKGVSEILHQDERSAYAKDGMDIALCSVNFHTLELEFAGAINPLYLIRDGELKEIDGNRYPIGFYDGRSNKKYTNNVLQLKKDDSIYLFSDGFADQFGGPQGRKYMARQFRKLLLSIYSYPMDEQRAILNNTFETWKGAHEQVDDILIMGIRI